METEFALLGELYPTSISASMVYATRILSKMVILMISDIYVEMQEPGTSIFIIVTIELPNRILAIGLFV